MGTLAADLRRHAATMDALAADVAGMNVKFKGDAAEFVEVTQPAEVYNRTVDGMVAQGQWFRAKLSDMAASMRADADLIEAEGWDI